MGGHVSIIKVVLYFEAFKAGIKSSNGEGKVLERFSKKFSLFLKYRGVQSSRMKGERTVEDNSHSIYISFKKKSVKRTDEKTKAIPAY